MQPRANIYPEATEGRVKTSNTQRPDEAKIISADVEGSKKYENFKQNVREAKSVQLEDNLFGRIVFFTIGLFALSFADKLYGTFLPIIGIIIKIVGAIFIVLLVYHVIRQIQISLASHRYKKNRKKNS